MKRFDQFHDGFLEGLWIDEKTVHVHLSTLDKDRFTAVAEGVVALSASGFRSGNLIFWVVTRTNEEIDSGDISELYDLQDGPTDESQRIRELEKARQEGLLLLAVDPSYGASCLVLAHSVNLLGRNEWLARYIVPTAK